MRPASMLGLAAIGLAIAFNVPYAVLASIYDYPDVLRGSPADALDAFAALGSSVILAWHGFALAALAFAPLAIGLAITPERLRTGPALSIAAAVIGALSGFAQAIGLWRWVFVIPDLARRHNSPGASPVAQASAERAFELLNAYGGVAIGEHLGQLLMVMFVAMLSVMQWRERQATSATLGAMTSITMAIGTLEGLAIALGGTGQPFGLATVAGFLALTAWLIATGSGLIRARPVA